MIAIGTTTARSWLAVWLMSYTAAASPATPQSRAPECVRCLAAARRGSWGVAFIAAVELCPPAFSVASNWIDPPVRGDERRRPRGRRCTPPAAFAGPRARRSGSRLRRAQPRVQPCAARTASAPCRSGSSGPASCVNRPMSAAFWSAVRSRCGLAPDRLASRRGPGWPDCWRSAGSAWPARCCRPPHPSPSARSGRRRSRPPCSPARPRPARGTPARRPRASRPGCWTSRAGDRAPDALPLSSRARSWRARTRARPRIASSAGSRVRPISSITATPTASGMPRSW